MTYPVQRLVVTDAPGGSVLSSAPVNIVNPDGTPAIPRRARAVDDAKGKTVADVTATVNALLASLREAGVLEGQERHDGRLRDRG